VTSSNIVRSSNKELAALRKTARLASELCNSIDAEYMDVGGHRPSDEILKELGPACDASDKFLEAKR
jgi:hypothetical protein